MEEVRIEQQPTTDIAAVEPQGALSTTINYLDSNAMNKAYKTASILSRSDLMPEAYKGKPENVLIAMDIASRMGCSLSLVAQNLYIVKGKPAWSGQFCIAAVNSCGRFTPLKFVDVEEGGGGCYAMATRLVDGEVCCSPVITMQLAKDEGWLDKAGSKWKTDLRHQMMRYRAAAFFARTFCPEVLLGLQTVEEVKDVKGDEPEKVTIKLS